MFWFNLCIFLFIYLKKPLLSFYRYVTSSLLLNDCQYLKFPCRSHVYLQNICSGQNYNVRLLTFLTISKYCIFNSINGHIKHVKYYRFYLYGNMQTISNIDKLCENIQFRKIIFLSFVILTYYTLRTHEQTSIPQELLNRERSLNAHQSRDQTVKSFQHHFGSGVIYF